MRKDFRREKIVTFVAVALAVVAFIVVVILNRPAEISDDYFTSDETKLVLNLNKATANFENGEYEPEETHVVYYLDGEKVASAKIYFEYLDAAAAKVANENILMSVKDWATTKTLNGKYIVFNVKPREYQGLSAEKVRENIATMRAAGGTTD